MRIFKDWNERYEGWDNADGKTVDMQEPDAKLVSLRTPDYGRAHWVAPVSPIDAGAFGLQSNRSGIVLYATSHALGSVPPGGGRTTNSIWQCWFNFGVTESGAVEASNTQVEFRVGENFATYDTIATGNTEGNPAAGETVYVRVSFGGERLYRPSPNKTLFVHVTRNGAASVDFDNESLTFGFDLLQERIA